jgi:hypothetical protein
MMFVYDAIDNDVGKELRKKNPNPHFLQNHQQWLQLESGHAIPPPHAADMEITISKIAAVVIAVGYAIAIVFNTGFTTQATGAVLLFVPLALIWFPEELGGYTGYFSRGATIDTETPPVVVSLLGWLFLVLIGVPIVAISLGYQ